MRTRTTAFLVAVVLALTVVPALAGDLVDPSFGDGGWVVTDVDIVDEASSVLVDSAGRILIGGTAVPAGLLPYGVLLRYLPDGSLDASFGVDGIVTLVRAGTSFGIADMALDATGRIVVVGSNSVARVQASGTLDPTFGSAGFATAGVTGHGVAIQDDGKIVVVGSHTGDFAVARLQTSGALDTTFSDDGFLTEALSPMYSNARSVAIDETGNIVVAGDSGGPPVPEILRYDKDGIRDLGFVLDERVVREVGYAFYASDVDLHADGKITMSGRALGVKYFDNSWSVVRLESDGSLDTGFGVSGVFRMGGWAARHEVAADGRILVAVISNQFDYEHPVDTVPGAIVQLGPDGTYQGSFELPPGGIVGHFRDVAFLGDGSVVGTGDFLAFPGADFLVAKPSGFNMGPSATDSMFDVADTAAVGSIIGAVEASDDGLGDSLTYVVKSGDGDVLTVDSLTGDIVLGAALASTVDDYHGVIVEVSDGYGSALATIAVNVLDSPRFTDVAESSLFYSEIDWIADRHITYGCNKEQTLFCPDASVTRGQMAAFLVRAFDLEATTEDFFDDDNTSVFEADINRLAAAEITLGCGDRIFCPDASVTRDQMAAFLVRALDLPATEVDLFDDDNTSVFEADINRLAAAEITLGCGDRAFCPTESATRGQTAAFIERAFK